MCGWDVWIICGLRKDGDGEKETEREREKEKMGANRKKGKALFLWGEGCVFYDGIIPKEGGEGEIHQLTIPKGKRSSQINRVAVTEK